MRPIHGCPENFQDSLTTATATFPKIFLWAFVLINRMNVCTNLKFVALLVPEIIGGTPQFGQSLDMPTLRFLQHVYDVIQSFWMHSMNVPCQTWKSVALTIPELIGGSPILRREGHMGSGIVPLTVRKSIGEFL